MTKPHLDHRPALLRFFCLTQKLIRDVELNLHPIGLPVVSDEAMNDPRHYGSTRLPRRSGDR
jgi:hypothetical protein